MAYTAGTGFRFYRSLSGQGEMPAPIRFRIANSATLRIGDAVRIDTDGFCVKAAGGDAILGVVVGLTDENGINILGHGVTNNTGATLTGDDTVAVASDNESRAHYVMAEVPMDPAGDILWLNDADDALTQSNLMQFFDHDSNARQVAVSGASDTSGQWQLVILDPEATGGKAADTSKGAFRVAEPQLMTYHANATAVGEA